MSGTQSLENQEELTGMHLGSPAGRAALWGPLGDALPQGHQQTAVSHGAPCVRQLCWFFRSLRCVIVILIITLINAS